MSSVDDEILRGAKGCAARLTSLRPKRIDATAFNRKSEAPFKAAMTRELLLYRTTDLADASISFFEQKRIVPAIILMRSVLETFAVLFALHKRIEIFVNDKPKDVKDLNDFIERLLMGSKKKEFAELTAEAVNVLTCIDHADKTLPGFRVGYDTLSEFAHPNWAGCLGAYGETAAETPGVNLGMTPKAGAYSAGVVMLSGLLAGIELFYNKTGELVRKLDEHPAA
jgi:hypothetical protein